MVSICFKTFVSLHFILTFNIVIYSSHLGTDTEPHDRALIRAITSEYTAKKQVKGDPYRTVFIGRLNPRTTQVTIY